MKHDKRAAISTILALPVRRGDVVLPVGTDVSGMRLYAMQLGIKLMTRNRPDGVHVWRLE